GGGGRHEGHVVERRDEDAAVERVQVQVLLECEVVGVGGFAPVGGGGGSKAVLGARPELSDLPGGAELVDRRLHAGCPFGGTRDHARVDLGGEHIGEGGPDAGHRHGV